MGDTHQLVRKRDYSIHLWVDAILCVCVNKKWPLGKNSFSNKVTFGCVIFFLFKGMKWIITLLISSCTLTSSIPCCTFPFIFSIRSGFRVSFVIKTLWFLLAKIFAFLSNRIFFSGGGCLFGSRDYIRSIYNWTLNFPVKNCRDDCTLVYGFCSSSKIHTFM